MKVNQVLSLSFCIALFGCASTEHKNADSTASHAYKISPTTVSDLIQAESAEQYYQIGRNYQKNGKYDLAIIAFQKALVLENKNNTDLEKKYSDSMTGLASAYADQKLYFLAIPLFREATRLDPTPINYNNLGYAYYLDGQYEEASNALKMALEIDPKYAQAKKNLTKVNQHLEPNIATNHNTPLLEQTNHSYQPDNLNHDTALEENITKSSTEVVDGSDVALTKTNNGIYELSYENQTKKSDEAIKEVVLNDKQELRKSENIQVLASGGISFKLVPIMNKMFDIGNNLYALFSPINKDKYIEVVNGNGLKGIAGAVATKLKEGGAENNFRVSDAAKFNKSITFIYYRSEYRDDAVKLNNTLLNHPKLVRNNQLPNDVMIRLVLGRDLIS